MDRGREFTQPLLFLRSLPLVATRDKCWSRCRNLSTLLCEAERGRHADYAFRGDPSYRPIDISKGVPRDCGRAAGQQGQTGESEEELTLDAKRHPAVALVTRGGQLGTMGLGAGCPRWHSICLAHCGMSSTGASRHRSAEGFPRSRFTSTLQPINRLEAAIRLDHGEENPVHTLVIV